MLISIIMPVYNAESYIKNALDSIFNQDYKDLEVIVVNDGSNDNSVEIIKNYPVKLINQENKGAAAARNKGIKHASGDYIYFMDADDTLKENSLAAMSVLINNNVDLVIGLYSMINIDSNQIILHKDNRITSEMINHKPQNEVLKILSKYRLSSSPWRYFIKKEIIIDNNLFFNENSLVEDAIWVPKLLCSANSYMLNDIPFYNYNIHSNSVSTSKKFKFYEDVLNGCNDLYNYAITLPKDKQNLIYSYYMMLLVGVMQDYGYMKKEEKQVIDNWFRVYNREVSVCMQAIKPLKTASIIGNRNILWLLGKYLKRKNRIN